MYSKMEKPKVSIELDGVDHSQKKDPDRQLN